MQPLILSLLLVPAFSQQCLTTDSTALPDVPKLLTVPSSNSNVKFKFILNLSLKTSAAPALDKILLANALSFYYGSTVVNNCPADGTNCCNGLIDVPSNEIIINQNQNAATITYFVDYNFRQFTNCPSTDYQQFFSGNSATTGNQIFTVLSGNFNTLTSNYNLIGYTFDNSAICTLGK